MSQYHVATNTMSYHGLEILSQGANMTCWCLRLSVFEVIQTVGMGK